MKLLVFHGSHKRYAQDNTRADVAIGELIRSGYMKLVRAGRRHDDIFAAVGLAAGGDVEGATRLLSQVTGTSEYSKTKASEPK